MNHSRYMYSFVNIYNPKPVRLYSFCISPISVKLRKKRIIVKINKYISHWKVRKEDINKEETEMNSLQN